jgi:serpin B
VDAQTRLVLVNAIYFKGSWRTPFQPRSTHQDQFHLADGSAQPVSLMANTFEPYQVRYADTTTGPVPCQVLSLDYLERSGPPQGGPAAPGSGLSMLVVLPRAAGDLGALEKGLTAEQLSGWVNQLAAARVQVFLPKFKIEQRFSLADQLRALGVVNAFISPLGASPGNSKVADFSGMDGAHDLFISKVIHQAFVAVDEAGTEAAAATAVGMGGGRARPTPPPVFRADHAFLFFIRENSTGSILFMGRLASPPTS